VIYHDVGGAHSSCTAANIHINKLPMDRVPSREELLNLSTFDKITKDDQGHLIYLGDDEFGAKVYTLSRQYKPQLVIPAIIDTYRILNGDIVGLFMGDTSPTVNNLMRIGGFSSRRLHWVSFGRPIVTTGTLKAYMDIVNVVKNVKEEMSNKK
jgi:Protein of unknown function (DUF3189)